MSRKSFSNVILTVLLCILGAQATAVVTVGNGMPDLRDLALKMIVIALIFWREKSRASLENQLHADHAKMAAQSVLAKRVAHDIRSPLSALQLIVNTLHGDNREQKQIILDVVSRINGIANDILTSEKSEVVVAPVVVAKKQVGKTLNIKNMMDLLTAEKAALAPKVQFVKNIKAEVLKWNGSEIELSRVLSNILNNSVESTSGTSAIHINTYTAQDFMYVEVVDFGCGMTEEVLSKLGREKITTKGAQGNGIGLSSAFEKIESWGGEILVQSKLDVGTKVTIKLPVVG